MLSLHASGWLRALAFAAVAVTFAASHSLAEEDRHVDVEETHDNGDDHGERGAQSQELVRLSPEALEEFEVRIATATPGSVSQRVSLPAEVRPNQDHLSHIAPRFPGIVTEVRKNIGDSVKAGETLAVVESSETLTTFPLKTLIDGVVIAKHITRGEPISPGGDISFTVANLDDVWIDISVYPKEMSLVQVGQSVNISAGHGLATVEGKISYVAPIVDEVTRTSTARAVIPNPDGTWRPGMFVTTSIEVIRKEVAIAVPRSAIEMADGSPVIFVQVEDGFELRPVVLGTKGVEFVEVREGLSAGEKYVAEGGFTIKSELAREELSGGHNH